VTGFAQLPGVAYPGSLTVRPREGHFSALENNPIGPPGRKGPNKNRPGPLDKRRSFIDGTCLCRGANLSV